MRFKPRKWRGESVGRDLLKVEEEGQEVEEEERKVRDRIKRRRERQGGANI